VQGIDPNNFENKSIVKYSYPTSFRKIDILNIETQTIFIKLNTKKKESDILIIETQMVSKIYIKKSLIPHQNLVNTKYIVILLKVNEFLYTREEKVASRCNLCIDVNGSPFFLTLVSCYQASGY
jgi:hypothetical protein